MDPGNLNNFETVKIVGTSKAELDPFYNMSLWKLWLKMIHLGAK